MNSTYEFTSKEGPKVKMKFFLKTKSWRKISEGLKRKIGIFIGTKNIFNPKFNPWNKYEIFFSCPSCQKNYISALWWFFFIEMSLEYIVWRTSLFPLIYFSCLEFTLATKEFNIIFFLFCKKFGKQQPFIFFFSSFFNFFLLFRLI